MFMETLAAKQAGNEKLADFYVERFPPDVRMAYDAWLAQKPFEKSKCRFTSIRAQTLRDTRDREAAELNAKAAGSLQETRRAGSVSCQYLANTVLFATVLFFASASEKI